VLGWSTRTLPLERIVGGGDRGYGVAEGITCLRCTRKVSWHRNTDASADMMDRDQIDSMFTLTGDVTVGRTDV
jgi:hypothetical protein